MYLLLRKMRETEKNRNRESGNWRPTRPSGRLSERRASTPRFFVPSRHNNPHHLIFRRELSVRESSRRCLFAMNETGRESTLCSGVWREVFGEKVLKKSRRKLRKGKARLTWDTNNRYLSLVL
jgi:hypothetical protein